MKRTAIAAVLLTTVFLVLPLPATGSPDRSPNHPAPATAPAAGVSIALPKQVVEGQRYRVRVSIARPRRYKRIELQRVTYDVLGHSEWVTQRRFAPRRKLTVRAVAGAQDRDRYRAVLVPTRGRATKSRTAATRVWHWYALTAFDAYYQTSGVLNTDLLSFSMNGRQYKGWRTSGTYGAWEARFTPGRHCRSLRGDFGVRDDSSDGSSAAFEIKIDGDRSAYVSPTLTPGMVVAKTVALRRTYRFSVLATDTSPDGVYAFPAIGAAELLCTGFEDS